MLLVLTMYRLLQWRSYGSDHVRRINRECTYGYMVNWLLSDSVKTKQPSIDTKSGLEFWSMSTRLTRVRRCLVRRYTYTHTHLLRQGKQTLRMKLIGSPPTRIQSCRIATTRPSRRWNRRVSRGGQIWDLYGFIVVFELPPRRRGRSRRGKSICDTDVCVEGSCDYGAAVGAGWEYVFFSIYCYFLG